MLVLAAALFYKRATGVRRADNNISPLQEGRTKESKAKAVFFAMALNPVRF